jgi:protein-S-isoprenylcysteine O-methyltransferase Ste14
LNAVVGIIGNQGNPAFFGVLAVGFISAFIARFQPRGMSRALFATAVAQALVPLIALIWGPAIDFSPGVVPVLGLNAFFVAMWVVSALLIRQAADPWSKIRREERGRGASQEGVAD